MSKFSDFVKEDKNKDIDSSKDQSTTDNIEEIINKYSGYSETDLMKEFVKESERKKQSGDFTDEKINSIKNILSPYLDETQKEKLNELLNMVK